MMHKLTYFAVFEPTKDGFSVYFPDFDGCISFGKTYEEARKEATDALALHVYGMERDGEVLPDPSRVPVIDSNTADGFILSPVTIYPDMTMNEMDHKKVKTNVTIPSWLKDLAEKQGVNYSWILENALIDYLNVDQKPKIECSKKRIKI